jgi:PKD repeat protein
MFPRLRRAGLEPCPHNGAFASGRPTCRHPFAGFTMLVLLAIAAIPFAAMPASADIVEKRTAASADDAEQAASGSMYLNSSDLEFVFDASLTSNPQTVGMRFTGLQIPPGATITAAYIQFVAKEAQSESTNVAIRGEAADNAAIFATTASNISTRPRTTAATTWIPAAWTAGAAGAAQRTPDLTNVIREVVGRPGWVLGNSLAIIVTGMGHRTAYAFDATATQCPLLHVEFTRGASPTAMLSVSQLPTPALTVRADGAASLAGSGGAIASYTFNFGDGTAPVTTVAPATTAQHTYAAAGPYTVTLTVTDAGSNVSSPAAAGFTVQANTAPVARLSLSQLATPALTARADGSTSTDTDFAPIASYQFTFGDGTAPVTTTAPTAVAQHTYAAPGTYTVTLTATDAGGLTSLPATAAINVQADNPPVARLTVTQVPSPALTAVADGATSTDGDMTPISTYRFTFGDGTAAVTTTAPTANAQHTYAAPGTYTVTLIATDSGGNASPAVTASVVVTPPASGVTTVEKRVAASSDDAEQAASGSVVLTSSDLEMVFDTSNQTVGMRWTALAIPNGASITAAYVQFVADESQSEVTSLTISGQAADSAATFGTASGNVSTRLRTTATVAWSPNLWTAGQVGFDQRTPDLSLVIQEIVGRSGWKSGNALALVITGTGHRTAVAWDGSAAQAPLLHVEYVLAGAPTAQLSVTPLATPPYTASADGSASTATDGKTIASYRFDFGDGTAAVTTTAPNATAQHTYAAAGTYTVSLIVTDSGGRNSPAVTRSVTFSPEAPPTARLSVSQLATPVLTVSANGSASTDPDPTPIATYRFDFGDGTAPVVTNAPTATAQHTYAAAGTYTVTLIATDTGGFASAPATASIVVQAEQIPVARLSVTQAVPNPPLTANANGSTSTDPDHTPIATYRFDFGDGTAAVTTSAPTATAQHTYAAAGTYTVSLIVTDTGGNPSAPATSSITIVREDPPVARISVTQLVTPALTVRADGSTSTDADLTPIANYRFNFGDGTAVVTVNAPTATAQHAYAAAGTYTVSVIATDTGGNASTAATASIVVVPENPPTARLTVTQLGSPALTVSADASTSTDADLTPIATCRFDFGDGTAPVTTTWPAASAQHTYPAAGNFVVTLIVTDTGGNASAPATVTIPVLGLVSTERRVAASTDDAEERVSNGSMNLTSSTLDLVTASSNVQTVGIRWTGIPIPRAATISAAYIQFSASASQSAAASLTIAGQAADNAATFTSSSGNVSSRARTTATVAWSPAAWTSGQTGAAQRSPDLTAVIREIVNRSGWASGNALTLIITGTGTRGAYGYDGSTASAPLLHIDYLGVGNGPTARLTVSQTGNLTATANGSTSTAGDSPIATYRFTFGDGTSAVTTTAPTATAQHTYASAGTYTVTLIATDTAGRPSAPATASVTVSASTSGPIAVYVGYYDTHHSEHLRTKPNPWYGSPGITFVGTPDSGSGGWDSSGIRIDNLSTGPVTVTVTVDMGSSHFGLWGSRTIPFEGTLVLAQTGFENFDGSDTNPAGCYGCNPNLCTTQVQSTVPVVHITMNGTTTNYYDTGQISNTHGVDMAGCPDTGGTRNDESQVWTQIFSSAPQAMMSSTDAAVGEQEPVPTATRKLSFAPVFPNPAGVQLTLRYTIPSQDNVEIGIFDVSGRRVRSNMSQDLPAGEYVSVVNLSSVPAGMYYCTLRVGNRVLHQRFAHVQ